MRAWLCSPEAPTTVCGLPRRGKLPPIHGWPKPILKAHRTHTMRGRENVLHTISTVLTAHLCCTRPPYTTARAGMLMRPTRVAAVICHALSPDDSQLA